MATERFLIRTVAVPVTIEKIKTKERIFSNRFKVGHKVPNELA